MKKLSKLGKMVLLLLMVACSSESEISGIANVNYQKRINQVINENDNSTQRIMYSMLDKEDKYKFWHDKIEKLLQEKSLDNRQIYALNLVLKSLSTEIFDDNENDSKIVFRTFQANTLIEELSKNFDTKFIIENFYSLRNGGVGIVPPPDLDGDAVKDCTCNIGSTFSCSAGVECKRYGSCKASGSGCGFLWGFPCDGNCM
jgi:hypothetical protein